jgi:hypothetical protein
MGEQLLSMMVGIVDAYLVDTWAPPRWLPSAWPTSGS